MHGRTLLLFFRLTFGVRLLVVASLHNFKNMRSFTVLLFSVILYFAGSDGQVVQTIGQELGLSLLDGLLRRSKEQMALTALKRQIEIYEKVDPQSAKLLKNVPTETMVGIIVDSQENQSVPATGNPFLNILAKNGIVVNGQASKTANDSQQGFPVAEVVQADRPPGAIRIFPSRSWVCRSGRPAPVRLRVRFRFCPARRRWIAGVELGWRDGPTPGSFAGISDLDNDPSAQIQLEGEADGEPVENVTATTTTTTVTTAAAPTPTRTTAPTPQAFKQAIQEHVTPSSTTVGTTATRRPIGSRLNELNRRVNRLTTDRPYNYRIQNGNAIRSNRLQPSVTIRPVNVIRPESKAGPVDEQSVPIDPAMPSVHSMMLMNTWQSLSENEKKNPTKPSPAEAYFGRFSPGPVKFETTETKSHSALKATTNVSKYRQRSMNVQLPGGRTASLGDHGLSGADLRGSLTVPKNWLAGHKLGGQMETGHFNDASAFFDFFTSAEDYTWPLFRNDTCNFADCKQAEGENLHRRNAFPNLVASHVSEPYFIRGLNIPLEQDAYKGGIIVGKANRIPPPPADAFRTLTFSDGSKILIPKAIYSRRSFRTSVGGDMATPNFQQPHRILSQFGNISGTLEEEEKIHSGLYLPMPFGLNPVALEIVGDGVEQNRKDLNLGVKGLNRDDKNRPTLIPACQLYSSLHSGNFMERFGDNFMPTVLGTLDNWKYSSEMESSSQTESEAEIVWQNVKEAILNHPNPLEMAKRTVESGNFVNNRRDSMPISNTNLENKEKSIGIVMSAPGLDPIYLGGFWDHAHNEDH
ncbi:Protein deadlock [Trichinella spiralis]|uniref:Protein deadlock n=1 Tax=Trichinella spiralis TaxID=6334 RepID=A0ABR3KC59_TRISP